MDNMENFKKEKNPLIYTNTKLNYTKVLLVLISFVSVFFSGIKVVNAASLYFSPSSSFYLIDQSFSVIVYVSSTEQAMNAASGVISFPQDKLEVVSLSKSGSILSLWVQGPTFSNSTGIITFEGIVLNPGFTGSNGKTITANLKVKAAGTAILSFFSGSVLANDGKGTNILTSLGNATFGLGGATPPTVSEPIIPGTPQAPQIISSTHPDSEKWYSNNDPKFTWEVSEDVTGVKLLVSSKPVDTPTIFYSEPISEKQLEDLADGVWYFHVQLQNKFGWGEISHFRFQIDTTLLESPMITEYPKELISGSPLLIKGISLPKVTVNLYIQKEGKIETGKIPSDEKGNWFYIHDRILENGVYTIFAEAINLKGAKSNPSEKVVILITPPAFIRIGGIIIDYLSLAIIISVLGAVVIFEILWIFKKVRQTRRKLKKETREVEQALYQAFKTLRKEIKEQVTKLDGRPELSEREKEILDGFKKALKNSEKFIGKEIKDIERELE